MRLRLCFSAALHRSPGHYIDGGSLTEIFVDCNVTRWLRLYA
jgi:hypothetical protein